MSDTVTLVGCSGSEDNRTIIQCETYIALQMGMLNNKHMILDMSDTNTTNYLCGNKAGGEIFTTENLGTATSHDIMDITEKLILGYVIIGKISTVITLMWGRVLRHYCPNIHCPNIQTNGMLVTVFFPFNFQISSQFR